MLMIFPGRQAIINNRHLLILGKRKCDNGQLLLQRQQQFGSNTFNSLLASKEDQKQQLQSNNNKKTVLSGHYNAQIGGGDYQKMLKRFFASSSSSSEHGQQQFGRKSFKERRAAANLDEEDESIVMASAYLLATKSFHLGLNNVLSVNMSQGSGGRKFIEIEKTLKNHQRFDLPRLPIEESYQMVRAMDSLIDTLIVADKSDDELEECEEHINDTLFVDIQLEICWLANGTCEFKISCRVKGMEEEDDKEGRKELQVPVRALPWLRHTMAQMLTEHDGSQQLGPEPPKLPETILKATTTSSKRPKKK